MRYLILPVILAGCMTSAPMSQSEQLCMAQATREVPQRLDYAGIDLNHDIRMNAYKRCIIAQ